MLHRHGRVQQALRRYRRTSRLAGILADVIVWIALIRHRLQERIAGRRVAMRHPRRPWAEAVAEHDDAEAPVAAPITEDDESTCGPDSYFARTMNHDD